MSADVIVRAARPTDAAEVAPLIYAAGPTLYTLMFGPDPVDVLRLFERLFALPCNPFSYERGLLAEQDGRVVGLALAAPAAAPRWSALRMAILLPRLRGLRPLLRRWRHLRDIGACISPMPRDAYYLGILAVAPEVRCQGVGSALMDEVHHRARMAGAPGVALHAEIDNVAALRFYARHGYTESQRLVASPRLAHNGIAGLATLRKTL